MLEDSFGSALVIILTMQLSLKDFGNNNRNIQKVKICYSNSAVIFFFLLEDEYQSSIHILIYNTWRGLSCLDCCLSLLHVLLEASLVHCSGAWHFVILKCKSINVTSTSHFNGLALPFIPSLWASLNFFLPTGFYMCYVPCGTLSCYPNWSGQFKIYTCFCVLT